MHVEKVKKTKQKSHLFIDAGAKSIPQDADFDGAPGILFSSFLSNCSHTVILK